MSLLHDLQKAIAEGRHISKPTPLPTVPAHHEHTEADSHAWADSVADYADRESQKKSQDRSNADTAR